jgi:hypothetical protein
VQGQEVNGKKGKIKIGKISESKGVAMNQRFGH